MCFTPSSSTNGENFRLYDKFPEFFNDEDTGCNEDNNRPIVLRERVGSEQGTDLDADDFTEIAGTIRGFFMTKGEVMVMEAMMAEHQPKT